MVKSRLLITAVLAAAAASPVAAQKYQTFLLGSNETVPNNSPAKGFGTLLLSGNGQFAQIDISFTGLTAPITIGHAHCCALPGANAGVAIDFLPPSITNGTISRFYDLSLASTYTAGFINTSGPNAMNGTVAQAQQRFLDGLNAGGVYYNLHTSNFPGGEIRGNLNAVPEPASWAMLICGFGLVGATLRRRREAVA